jgi:hypothetical protein
MVFFCVDLDCDILLEFFVVFDPFKDARTDILLPKLLFIAMNFAALGLGLYKVGSHTNAEVTSVTFIISIIFSSKSVLISCACFSLTAIEPTPNSDTKESLLNFLRVKESFI